MNGHGHNNKRWMVEKLVLHVYVNFFFAIFFVVVYNFKCYCKVNNFCLNASMHRSGLALCHRPFYYFSTTHFFFALFFWCFFGIYCIHTQNARSFRMDELTSSRNNKISAFELLSMCVLYLRRKTRRTDRVFS